MPNNEKYDVDFVKLYLSKFEYTLLDDVYVNANTKLNIMCPKGHKFTSSFHKFKNHEKRCDKCQKRKRYTYDDVKFEFEEVGYKLISTSYKRKKDKLSVKCNKGHKIEMSFDKFSQGQRCKKCHYKNRKKDGHWNWKGGISNESSAIRSSEEYAKWRNEIFQRDSYTCQCCNKKGLHLHAHHIENFSSNKEKRFDVDNGITLCKECHEEYHILFGRKNNNLKELRIFIDMF